MPETGFTLQLIDIQKQVAFHMFGQRDITRLEKIDMETLDTVINNGLSGFYYPEQVGGGILHDWSFLRSKLTVKINTGLSDYEMPADFGGAEGDLFHDANDNVRVVVKKVTESYINRQRSQLILVTSWPRYYAERAVQKAGRESMRWELMFWPDPGAAYTLYGTYRVLPLAPGTANPYLYGGPEHARTILESCLAEAELQVDGAPGPHYAAFQKRLATSIMFDQSNHMADSLGYNGNPRSRGSDPLMRDNFHFECFSPVTSQGRTP